jgi:RND family efflux transporter MFP subunit
MAEPIQVQTTTLKSVLEVPVYSVPATVVARHEPRIAAEIAAAVVAMPVNVGDRVEPGDELARMDCTRYEAQKTAAIAAQTRAAAQLEFAERQLQRARDLRKKKSISEELLDQRRTELAGAETEQQSARASLSLAEFDVANCVVRSPLTAVVTARHASVGDYVSPGSPLLDLTEMAGQEVSAALRSDQVDTFRDAERWEYAASAGTHTLRLRTILPVADPLARTREARLVFDGEPVIPGSAGRVTWSSGDVRIPAEYLVRRDGQLGIFVLDGGTSRFVPLPGALEGRPASTTLPPDTRLITAGRQRLSDGDAVEVAAREGAGG